MNRLLLLDGLACWNPQNQQNRPNGNEKPEYLHEFLCESGSVSTGFEPSFCSIIHPIQASWTDRSSLKRWPVEILKISKISKMQMKNLNISMNSCANRNLFGPNSSDWRAPYFIPYMFHVQTAPSWSASQLKSSKSAKKAKINRRTLITPWVLDRFGWFLI